MTVARSNVRTMSSMPFSELTTGGTGGPLAVWGISGAAAHRVSSDFAKDSLRHSPTAVPSVIRAVDQRFFAL